MSKPSTSANANVDFNIADLANTIANFADNDRNDLVVVFENGTEAPYDINFRVDHGDFHGASNQSPYLPALTFVEGGHPKASDYEISFEAAGAGCNAVLAITSSKFPDTFRIMAATPVNKDNYFKFCINNQILDDQDKHFSSEGWKSFDVGVLRFVISITGTSPAVCKVLIEQIGAIA